MKAQSVLYYYMSLINWEWERTSIQFNFLGVESPFTTYFGKSPHMDSSPLNEKNTNPN